MNNSALGIVIKGYCRRNNETLKKLAQKLSIDYSNFSGVMLGKRDLPDEYYQPLSEITGYDIRYLYYLSGKLPDAPKPYTQKHFLDTYNEFLEKLSSQELY